MVNNTEPDFVMDSVMPHSVGGASLQEKLLDFVDCDGTSVCEVLTRRSNSTREKYVGTVVFVCLVTYLSD